MLEYNVDNNQT